MLGLNRTVDAATAHVLTEPGLFVEAIIAPAFDPEALAILTTVPKWKANVRLMAGPISRRARTGPIGPSKAACCCKMPTAARSGERWKVVSECQPTAAQMADLRFAWAMVRHVKSNAIVLAKDRMLLGAGQDR